MIDFVGDEADVFGIGIFDQPAQFVAGRDGSGGVGRAGDQDTCEPVLLMGGAQMLGCQDVAGGPVDLDLHRHQPERAQDVAIGRVAGRGERDPVTRIEGSEEGQVEARRRAGGDHDLRGIHRLAVGVGVMAGDALAKILAPEGVGIGDAAMVEHGAGGIAGDLRRRRGRLADRQRQHPVAPCDHPVGFGQNVHGAKRVDVGPL